MTSDVTAVALNDVKENPDEDDVKTAIEPKNTPRIGKINWSRMDEELRLAHQKRVENSRKPSMWEYNPTGGVPTELANLDSSTFLTSRLGQTLCSLPKDVLARVCSKLSVHDFLHLSLTCRFLHWRIFTFCTCYAPYTVTMYINLGSLSANMLNKMGIPPKSVYTVLNTQRGIFVRHPFCLRNPFFFDMLNLFLTIPFRDKKYYDMCLPYILAVRGFVRHLNLIFNYNSSGIWKGYPAGKAIFNFSDTNDFFVAVNATYYDIIDHGYPGNFTGMNTENLDIFMNCPYVRQMHGVKIGYLNRPDIIDVPVFQNCIGAYLYPLDSAVIATLENFITGSMNLVYHNYFKIERHNRRFPLIEYLFVEFGEFEEFLCSHLQNGIPLHIWKKVVATENGGLLRIIIRNDRYNASVTIGKEETFDEMDYKYHWICFDEGSMLWKMETAVEQDNAWESNKVEKDPDIAVEPYVAKEQDVAKKSNVTVELDVTEKLDEVEESAVDEEEQRGFDCLCLNNVSCSIQ